MPFQIKDCALITRMAGIESAVNLRELRDRIAFCPQECLFHHFSETLIRPSFDDPEYRNDLAVWSARVLRDRVLAERLGILNPYSFANLEELREVVIEIIDYRLAEIPFYTSVAKGEDFIFQRAATIVFDTGVSLKTPSELLRFLPDMSLSSLYYHFLEARRRTPDRLDDFSNWIREFANGYDDLLSSLKAIDFYYLTLTELKKQLVYLARPLLEKG